MHSDKGPWIPGRWPAPDGGWGWMVVFGVGLVFIVTVGPMGSFGLIFGAFLESIGAGTSDVTFINGLYFALSFLPGVLANRVLQLYTCRQVTIVGGLLFFIGCFLSAFANSVAYMVITFSIIQGTGLGLLLPASFTCLNHYFLRRRTSAMGTAQLLVAVGVMLYPFLIKNLLQIYGFRGTQAIIGALSLHTIVGAATMKPLDASVLRLRSRMWKNEIRITCDSPDREGKSICGENEGTHHRVTIDESAITHCKNQQKQQQINKDESSFKIYNSSEIAVCSKNISELTIEEETEDEINENNEKNVIPFIEVEVSTERIPHLEKSTESCESQFITSQTLSPSDILKAGSAGHITSTSADVHEPPAKSFVNYLSPLAVPVGNVGINKNLEYGRIDCINKETNVLGLKETILLDDESYEKEKMVTNCNIFERLSPVYKDNMDEKLHLCNEIACDSLACISNKAESPLFKQTEITSDVVRDTLFADCAQSEKFRQLNNAEHKIPLIDVKEYDPPTDSELPPKLHFLARSKSNRSLVSNNSQESGLLLHELLIPSRTHSFEIIDFEDDLRSTNSLQAFARDYPKHHNRYGKNPSRRNRNKYIKYKFHSEKEHTAPTETFQHSQDGYLLPYDVHKQKEGTRNGTLSHVQPMEECNSHVVQANNFDDHFHAINNIPNFKKSQPLSVLYHGNALERASSTSALMQMHRNEAEHADKGTPESQTNGFSAKKNLSSHSLRIDAGQTLSASFEYLHRSHHPGEGSERCSPFVTTKFVHSSHEEIKDDGGMDSDSMSLGSFEETNFRPPLRQRKQSVISWTADCLDLGLLKDLVYVNIILGVSFSLFSDNMFFNLQPLYYYTMEFSDSQIVNLITINSAADLVGRLCFVFFGSCLTNKSRFMFLLGSAATTIIRLVFLLTNGYLTMSVLTALLGFFRSWVNVSIPLIFAEYSSLERFPAAYGLYLLTTGLIHLLFGPFVGLIRDLSGSYPTCLGAVTGFMFLCVVTWSVEALFFREHSTFFMANY